MKNQNITKGEIEQIRSLNDFDLTMLLSEISDHGWTVAKCLLPLMREATEVHGDRREEPLQ